MDSKHAAASARIRTHASKQLSERYDSTKKLSGPAKIVAVWNPPIIRSEPIAPDAKLQKRVRHGS